MEYFFPLGLVGLILLIIGLMSFFIHPIMGVTWSLISIIIGPLIGAFCGVFLGFNKNRKHQEELNHNKKLFLLNLLRHEVKESVELLKGSGNLIPIDVWKSIVYSGNIVLFEFQEAVKLGDVYFMAQSYNYEAKRTRDAKEHFHSLPTPDLKVAGIKETDQYEYWNKAKERWEENNARLSKMNKDLNCKLACLEESTWFNLNKSHK